MLQRRLALVMAGLLLAGCGAGGESGTATTTTTATTVPTTTTTLADLTRLIVRTPPGTGFTAVADTYGPLTLERYIRDFSADPAGDRTLLTQAGFVQGYARGWVDKANQPTTLAVFVLELRDAAGAGSARDGLLRRQRGEVVFEVPSVPDATGVSSFVATTAGRQRRYRVAFVRESRLFIVTAQHANAQASTQAVLELAKAQAALAP